MTKSKGNPAEDPWRRVYLDQREALGLIARSLRTLREGDPDRERRMMNEDVEAAVGLAVRRIEAYYGLRGLSGSAAESIASRSDSA